MAAEKAPAKVLESDSQLIDRFADTLWMERGLSRNTLSSYQSDLRQAAGWLAGEGSSLELARRTDLLAYLAGLVDQQVKPRTSARRLSSLRQFYQLALREGWLPSDPTALIEAPKLGRPLPCSADRNSEVNCSADNITIRRSRAEAAVRMPSSKCVLPQPLGP